MPLVVRNGRREKVVVFTILVITLKAHEYAFELTHLLSADRTDSPVPHLISLPVQTSLRKIITGTIYQRFHTAALELDPAGFADVLAVVTCQ
jgi:hypothetical protein